MPYHQHAISVAGRVPAHVVSKFNPISKLAVKRNSNRFYIIPVGMKDLYLIEPLVFKAWAVTIYMRGEDLAEIP